MVLIYSLGVGGLGTLGPSGFLRFSIDVLCVYAFLILRPNLSI